MQRLSVIAALLAGAVPTVVAYAGLLGLGLHRSAAPWVISLSATVLVFGPALALSATARGDRRLLRLGLGLALWSLVLLLSLPVYFPGERRDAVATGLSIMGLGQLEQMARTVADALPEEPALSRPVAPPASAAEPPPEHAPPTPLRNDQIALPYEGEGRRMSVPVVFEHHDRSVEVYMMLDTGATYTTLPPSVLSELGIVPGPADPVIQLHTANGLRDAQIVLLEKVWLGDLSLEGIAIATCHNCASDDTVGLLGLNVAGGFNLNIDADREEVVFTSRPAFDRHLDVKPFASLDASFRRFPGGRVEVEVTLENTTQRAVTEAAALVRCGDASWNVDLGPVTAGDMVTRSRSLPWHEPCANYEYALSSASW